MYLSKSTIYGLQAAALLASKSNEDFVTIRELSNELNISFYFLTKVLQQLTKSELLISYKGPNGGVKLAKHCSEITFKDIICSIEGTKMINESTHGYNICKILSPCPFYQDLARLENKVEHFISTTTLKDLAKRDQLKQPTSKMPNNL